MRFKGTIVVQCGSKEKREAAVEDANDEVNERSTSDKPRLVLAVDGSHSGGKGGGGIGGSAVVWSANWMPSESANTHHAAAHQALQNGGESDEQPGENRGEEAVAFSNITGSKLAELCAISLALHVVDREIQEKKALLKPGMVLQIVIISDCASVLNQIDHGVGWKNWPKAIVDFIIQQSHDVFNHATTTGIQVNIRLRYCPRNETPCLKRADKLAGRARVRGLAYSTRGKNFFQQASRYPTWLDNGYPGLPELRAGQIIIVLTQSETRLKREAKIQRCIKTAQENVASPPLVSAQSQQAHARSEENRELVLWSQGKRKAGDEGADTHIPHKKAKLSQLMSASSLDIETRKPSEFTSDRVATFEKRHTDVHGALATTTSGRLSLQAGVAPAAQLIAKQWGSHLDSEQRIFVYNLARDEMILLPGPHAFRLYMSLHTPSVVVGADKRVNESASS